MDGLDARGTYGTTYEIHGNINESSIGRYASSGCVRMHNAEVRWLSDRVNTYTTVIILSSGSSFDAIGKANGYQVSVSASCSLSNPAGIDIPNGWVKYIHSWYFLYVSKEMAENSIMD
ncbi:L,D-transpeptidase family protein [Neobacillus bataviensis]|uniref:L,D-transpeptidase n=1 Tax=Neobacillus bataviensis TaxID=220685 RepID=UPI0028F6ECA9|nr:L,D-transpeptidase family protein [Neobacillus bataviensis]